MEEKELIKQLYEIQQQIYDIFHLLHAKGYRCLINIHLPQDDDHYKKDYLIVDKVSISDLTEDYRNE